MMEFRIQFPIEGEWSVVSPSVIEGGWRGTSSIIEDYNLAKCIIANLRKEHPECKYRIIGREVHPWREIKKCDVNMNKKYTAQKIREMEAIVASGDVGPMTRETVARMLRQAAEMRERCEEKRKELDDEWFYDGAENLTLPMNECYKIIDYIIRGDEGNEPVNE